MKGRHISLAILGAVSLHALLSCPYSKVEESFGLQGTHDLYYHGLAGALTDGKAELYDHLKYPGVVPRSFTGPALLAIPTRLLSWILYPLTQISARASTVEFLSRVTLLSLNLHAFHHLAAATDLAVSGPVGSYALLVTASQFHLPFYMSRTLANTFALVFVTHGYAYWFEGWVDRAVVCLVFATAVLRCDTVILLACVGCVLLLTGRLTFRRAMGVGVGAAVVSVVLTVPFDSLLWGRLVWPEGEVFFFNTVENKSGEWGVLPWHWYFSAAVPKAMLLTLFLVPLSVLRLPEVIGNWEIVHQTKRYSRYPVCYPLIDGQMGPYLVPVVAFLVLYSMLPHKETRFIFMALPMLNVAAARGLARLHQVVFRNWEQKKNDDHCDDGVPVAQRTSYNLILSKLLFLAALACVAATAAGSYLFLRISTKNYPGGEALRLLQSHVEHQSRQQSRQSTRLDVYIDNAAAMSGVSLFGQRRTMQSAAEGVQWHFHKAGYETENTFQDFTDFSHLLVESPADVEGFKIVAVAQGYPRFLWRERRIGTEDAIVVLEKEGWWQ